MFVTVALSVLARGATAAPLATRFADWLDGRSARSDSAPESNASAAVRWRRERETTSQ